MGAATALYSASCFTQGKYGNGNPYPAKLSAVVGLSGWLPCSKFVSTICLTHLNFALFLFAIKFDTYGYELYSFQDLG